MRYLSACAVIRDEAPYIVEWIEHHKSQGVEHFYLYDNESTDNIKQVIEPYKDIVTWHEVKGFKQQRVAYNHTIQVYKNDSVWCQFFDIDEFVYCTNKKPFVEVLKSTYDQEGISGVAIHWMLYGSSGELEYRDAPVKERFTKRASCVNHHIKSVMRMGDTVCMGADPHSFRHSGTVVNENFQELPLDYAIHTPATADKLVLNHYVTKSKNECLKRKLKPDANSAVYKDPMEQFLAHDCNDVEDRSILELCL